MSTSFIAPINLVSISLLETSFRVDPIGPTGNIATEVKLNHVFDGLNTDEESQARFGTVTLSVIAEMREEDSGRACMRGMVNLQGLLACPATDDIDDNELGQWVLSNGISMLYAHARSLFISLASQSPMGDFILPPIYVHEYLKMHEADESVDS